MNFLLWHREGHVGVASSQRVVRAAEVPLLANANDLCERLNALYSTETERLARACEDARERGYADGLRQGSTAAAEAHADRLRALATADARQRAELTGRVAALALQVARKMIGSLADDEQLVALARTAARDLLPAAALTLVVHPDRVDSVRNRLAREEPKAAGAADGAPLEWEVRADAGCPLDRCRIETGLGSADASLDMQMRRMAAAWGIEPDSRSAP